RSPLRRQARARAGRLRASAGRLPRRDRAEWLRQDDVAAALRGPADPDLRRAGGARRAWPARLPRARAARLPRADRDREPRPVRAALPCTGTAGAGRDAARALRPLGGPRRADRPVLARGAAASRPLPRAPPPSRAADPPLAREPGAPRRRKA